MGVCCANKNDKMVVYEPSRVESQYQTFEDEKEDIQSSEMGKAASNKSDKEEVKKTPVHKIIEKKIKTSESTKILTLAEMSN
jgi:hypothetical protein